MNKIITIEDLKNSIEDIHSAVNDIKNTGISEDALIVLIQNSAPKQGSRHQGYKMIGKTLIKDVLSGIENLKDYVFPGGSQQ